MSAQPYAYTIERQPNGYRVLITLYGEIVYTQRFTTASEAKSFGGMYCFSDAFRKSVRDDRRVKV